MRRLWGLPIGFHLAAAAVVLLIALALVGTYGVVSYDEGAYGAQARTLEEGSWSYPYQFQDVDPDGAWFPFDHAELGANGMFVYARQPLYPLVLSAVGAVGPEPLLFITSVLGSWCAAAAAACLASRGGFHAPRIALWVAVFSTLLVNSVLLWGHSLVAALAGWALVAILAAHRATSLARVAACATAAGALLAVGVLLRSEGALIAVGCAVAWTLLQARLRRGTTLALGLLGLFAPPALAFLALRHWVVAITGTAAGSLDRTGAGSFLSGRLNGMWVSVFEPASSGALVAAGAGAAAVAVAFWLGLRLRGGVTDHLRVVVVSALAVVGLVIVRSLADQGTMVRGLVSAWPLAAVAAGLLVRRPDTDVETVLLAFVVTTTGLVLATQYVDGGGPQWGGRYLTAVVVPLATLFALRAAAAGLTSTAPSVKVAIGLLVVVPSIVGLVAVRDIRSENGAIVDAVGAAAEPVIVTDMPWYGRAAWQRPDLTWALVRDGDPLAVAQRIAAARSAPVSVLRATPAEVPSGATDVTPPELGRLGVQLVTVPTPSNVRS